MEEPLTAGVQPEETPAEAPVTTPESAAPDTTPEDGEAVLTVKYNKELRTLSRDEATNYAQKGMKYDAVAPLLDTLRTVAENEGKTLTEWVAHTADSASAKAGEALAGRLADEFDELRREVPALTDFSAVPESVVREAVTEHRPLLDAYLRHSLREQRRIAAEQEAQRTAAVAGTGSQRSAAEAGATPVEAALVAGIWNH